MPITKSKKDTVEETSLAYDRMSVMWPLLHDLCGGTQAMREAGTLWLPQEPAESDEAYRVRLNRSVLFNAYRDTIDRLSSAPFAQPIGVTDCPQELEYLIKDTDGTGRDLNTLGMDCLKDMLKYGLSHVLVDFTNIPKNANPNEPASKAEEKALGARTTMVRVCPVELIGWREIPTSPNQLSEVRIKFERYEPKGEYLDEEVCYVKHLKIESWTLWVENPEHEKDSSKVAFKVKNSGTMSLGTLPLVTGYANQTGFMTADPPLLDLAWLNLCHWQSSSDQRNILRFSRFALLFMRGITKTESETPLTIGPTQLVRSTSETADLKYVEHTGKAIEAGAKDLVDLEGQMDALGKQPTVKGGRVQTATEVANNASKTLTELQSWVRILERLLTDAFQLAARWHRIELPETFSIQIYDEFDVSVFGDNDLDWILKAWMANMISQKTALQEAMRRGRLSENLDVDAEVSETAANQMEEPEEDPVEDESEDSEEKPTKPKA